MNRLLPTPVGETVAVDVRRLWCALYLWACRRAAEGGWYGVKTPYRREPLPPLIQWIRRVAATAFALTAPLVVAHQYGLLKIPDRWISAVGILFGGGLMLWSLPELDRRQADPIESSGAPADLSTEGE